ncbi:Hypothetical_protein [Hexamita inflata]|uniref:Hypothetical_protein n=1 Tax=Hexamita inflata TaxID=28002 RepID=A0AA86UNL8_9EUKA|nr:Hypothetical protein HINF_LOCUS33393 [Hexamita inflata]
MIQWKEIDRIIYQQYNISNFNSRQRFVKSIIPNSLPQYPKQLQDSIQQFIFNVILQLHEHLISDSSYEYTSTFVKQLLKITNEKFNLQPTDLYQFQKQQSKMRFQIQKQMKSFNSIHNITMSPYASIQSSTNDETNHSSLFPIENEESEIQESFSEFESEFELELFNLFTVNVFTAENSEQGQFSVHKYNE